MQAEPIRPPTRIKPSLTKGDKGINLPLLRGKPLTKSTNSFSKHSN